jgi:hypothetical protein
LKKPSIIKLKSLIKEAPEPPKDPNVSSDSEATDQAHQLGLVSKGWGRWADKTGKIVAKTVQGKLVKLAPEDHEEGDNQFTERPSQGKLKKTGEPIDIHRVTKDKQALYKNADGSEGMAHADDVDYNPEDVWHDFNPANVHSDEDEFDAYGNNYADMDAEFKQQQDAEKIAGSKEAPPPKDYFVRPEDPKFNPQTGEFEPEPEEDDVAPQSSKLGNIAKSIMSRKPSSPYSRNRDEYEKATADQWDRDDSALNAAETSLQGLDDDDNANDADDTISRVGGAMEALEAHLENRPMGSEEFKLAATAKSAYQTIIDNPNDMNVRYWAKKDLLASLKGLRDAFQKQSEEDMESPDPENDPEADRDFYRNI